MPGGLTGVPITLAGVPNIFSRTGHGNMSVSRNSRKAKPLKLEDQPQILQFIDGASETSQQRKDSKKRRRSTGEKSQAKKRVDSPCGSNSQTPNPPPLLDTNLHIDSQGQIACKLSSMHMDETNRRTNSTSPMLDEIMKWKQD